MQRILKERTFRYPRYVVSSLIVLAAFLSVLFIRPSNAHAAQVTLTWQRSRSAKVVGYIVYYGTSSRNYAYRLNVGNITTYTLGALTAGKRYYIAVAAYDFYDNESKPSNEITYTPTIATAFGIDRVDPASAMALAMNTERVW